MASLFVHLIILSGSNGRLTFVEESGRIVICENVQLSKGNYERGAQSLRVKMRNVELYLKGATVISTPCSRLQQVCPN